MILLLLVVVVLVAALVVALKRRVDAQREADLPAGTRVAAADLGPCIGVRELRGLTIRDDEWGLVGRPDLLIESAEDPIPIEYKLASRGRRPAHSYRSHRLQLGVHLLVCEADPQVGRRPPEGRLRYVDGDGRLLEGGEVSVPNTDALRAEVVRVVNQIRRDLRASDVHRSHLFPSRCRGCAMRGACGEAL